MSLIWLSMIQQDKKEPPWKNKFLWISCCILVFSSVYAFATMLIEGDTTARIYEHLWIQCTCRCKFFNLDEGQSHLELLPASYFHVYPDAIHNWGFLWSSPLVCCIYSSLVVSVGGASVLLKEIGCGMSDPYDLVTFCCGSSTFCRSLSRMFAGFLHSFGIDWIFHGDGSIFWFPILGIPGLILSHLTSQWWFCWEWSLLFTDSKFRFQNFL